MQYLFFLIAILLLGCVYDPPTPGKEIIIENQSDHFIFIADSLKGDNLPTRYDTALVNNSVYIAANGNYVPPYSKYIYFISDAEIEVCNRCPVFIVHEKYCTMSYDKIKAGNFYRKINIDFANLSKDSTYYLLVRDSAVQFTNQFDRSSIR